MGDRAERTGKDNGGRVYTVTLECTDAYADTSSKSVSVTFEELIYHGAIFRIVEESLGTTGIPRVSNGTRQFSNLLRQERNSRPDVAHRSRDVRLSLTKK